MQTSEIGAATAVQTFENTPSQEIGQDDFLKMLITQLENQDPLDPQDASEFTAQLATFSSLDQLVSMRTSIDELAEGQMTSQSLSVASLVGRNVLVESGSVDVNAQTNPSLALDLSGSGDVELQLIDSRGRIAASRQLNDLPRGRTDIDLSSFGASLPPGLYSIDANVPPGGPSVTSLVRSAVTGASFESGRSTLLLGSVEVPLADLREL